MPDPAHIPDPLKELDFQIEGLPCEVIKQPWLHYKNFLGRKIQVPFPDVPKGPAPCPHQATTLVHWRVCPCIANYNTWSENHPELVSTHSPLIVWGLCVVATSMCDSHIEYFVDYLTYPFACPQCGVAYGSPREMLLSGVDINEG